MRYCFFEMELEIELREGTGGANVVKIIKAGLCPVCRLGASLPVYEGFMFMLH